MAEQKGKKLRRAPKDKPYYKVQFGRTEDNKIRKLGRHIRQHPLDLQEQSQAVAEPIMGPLYERKCAGHVANKTAQAARKIKRKENRDAQHIIAGSDTTQA